MKNSAATALIDVPKSHLIKIRSMLAGDFVRVEVLASAAAGIKRQLKAMPATKLPATARATPKESPTTKQVYQLISSANGIYEWVAPCTDCGNSFTATTTSIRPKGINRRCPSCHAPGQRTNMKQIFKR